MKRYIALLAAALVVSCGGGGGDGGSTGESPSASGPSTGGSTPAGGSSPGGSAPGGGGSTGGSDAGGGGTTWPPAVSMRIEESDAAVSLSGDWTNPHPRWGHSGGTAVRSSAAGATASVTFIGNSIRWLSTRGRNMGTARVSVDGGPATIVDLRQNTGDVIRATGIAIYDLSDGPHTLTIEVVGDGLVVIDAFDVQLQTTVSHWQETDPNARFSAGWTKSSIDFPWSGNGAQNEPELPVTAMETTIAGETLTLPFRGTGISWVGYRGPDGGIAYVQIDGGAPIAVDTYAPSVKYQEVVFTATGLADTNHTLTITASGQSNPASRAARVVVDAFDVMTPGRRYENNDPAVTYRGNVWNRSHNARVWSAGTAATSNVTGATATFSFTGTSVSMIGCRKASAGGTARFYIDGVLVSQIRMKETYPIEGYQMTVFRVDGLTNGPHTLTVEVVSPTGGSYVVVDAFDVHP